MGGAVLVGVLSMLGVASLPSRSALRLGNRVPLGATPPAAVQAAPVPLQPPAISDAIKTKALSGSDILTGPNVFRGMSATGQLLENPAQLGRADELEVRACFQGGRGREAGLPSGVRVAPRVCRMGRG